VWGDWLQEGWGEGLGVLDVGVEEDEEEEEEEELLEDEGE